MRSIGGIEVNRLARTVQEATAEIQLTDDTIELNPVNVVSQNTLGTTSAGNPRLRRKWTNEVNLFIIRSYLTVTKLETDLIQYRRKLYESFRNKYPEILVSEQRIASQRSAIIRNNMIPNVVIEEIKKEVARELNISSDYVDSNNQIPDNEQVNMVQEPIIERVCHVNDVNNHVIQSDTDTKRLNEIFQELLIKYEGLYPGARPGLPKINSSKKLAATINIINTVILPKYVSEDINLENIQTLIYIGAATICRYIGMKLKDRRRIININPETIKIASNPKWRQRLENEVRNLRRDIGRLTEFLRNNRTQKLLKKLVPLFKKINFVVNHQASNKKIVEYLDTLKQKLAVKSCRLKRYNMSYLRKQHNNQFSSNERGFYKQLNQNSSNSHNGLPSSEELTDYWSSIWSSPSEYNKNATWISATENNAAEISPMEVNSITLQDVKESLKALHNWKSPGVDKIHNFWIKKFDILHNPIAKCYSDILEKPELLSEIFTQGITYLIPKSEETINPASYRPITCLPTLYKLLTTCITKKVNAHLDNNEIMAEQQKGCRRRHMGCKEQLVIDSTILSQAQKQNRNLSMAYIDYCKAFDSVPHDWLLRVMEIYKIDNMIINFLKITMRKWQTSLHLNIANNVIITDNIEIRRGIFQGDSLSALWFCLCLNPLSNILDASKYGFTLRSGKENLTTVSHLMYVDDIKVYAANEHQLEHLLNMTHTFSKDISMKFGTAKCRILHIKKGKIIDGSFNVDQNEIIRSMNENDLYKYLGIMQSKIIDHKVIKTQILDKFYARIRQLMKSYLSAKNMVKAINTYAMSLMIYSFGVIKWTDTEILDINRQLRVTMSKHRYHHPKSAIERFNLPRSDGGRGFIDLLYQNRKQINTLRNFFHRKAFTSKIHETVIKVDSNYTPLNLIQHAGGDISISTYTRRKIDEWLHKELHGRHPNILSKSTVDKLKSNKWLVVGDLFPETEGFIIAIQDETIKTRNYQKYILKDTTIENDKCRKCHLTSESIHHVIAGCKILANTDYLHRHNQVANIIHKKLANKYKLADITIPYYIYKADSILENTNYRLYYDISILTDKTIPCNRPDIVLVDKVKKTTYLIDIGIPLSHNLEKTISEKQTKYVELANEIRRLWRMDKVIIVPIIISATGVIPTGLSNSLKTLDLPESTYIELQKAVIINTCHITRKFLNDIDIAG